MNYIEQFNITVNRKADEAAVVDRNGERNTSYRELSSLSDRVAWELFRKGVTAGNFVVVKMSRKMEYVAAVLGIMKLGCAYVPVLPTYPEERIRQICGECECRYIITDEFFDELTEDNEKVILPEEFDADNAPVCLLFTSGTVGKPKGIVHTMNGFTSIIELQRGLMGGEKNSRTVLAEFSFVASTSEIFVSLLDGACIYMVDEKTRMSLTGFVDLIRRERIGGSFMTASHLRVLKSFSVLPKTIYLGGEPFPNIDKELFEKTDFFNVYGQSETLGITTVHSVKPGEYPVPVGKPISGLELRLIKEDGTDAASGEEGEICIVGPYGVSYLNNPQLTAEKFKNLPDGRQMIRTGDNGRLTEKGELIYVSRKDFMVKINGMRVDVSGVEAHIRAIDGVMQAAVKTVMNRTGSTCLAAYYTTSTDLDESELRKALSKKLPEYMMPQFIIRMPSFRLNSSGKVDRTVLPEPNFYGDMPYEEPADDTEAKLCSIFEKNLGYDRVGRNDDLRQLGGDSLSCMNIICDIEKEFHVQTDPTVMQNAATPKALACVIRGDKNANVIQSDISTFNVLVAVAMFLLPFVHLIGELVASEMVPEHFIRIGEAIELAASPALFMLIVGYKLSFGERKPGALIRTGFSFLKIALIFDFFRYIVSGVLYYAVFGCEGDFFIYFAASDIYMFIALFYITLGLIGKCRRPDITAAAVSVAMLVLFYIISGGFDGGDGFLSGTLLGNFIYTGEYSYFPLFGWMYVPMIGYFCGKYISSRPADKDKSIRRIGVLAACILAVCSVLFVLGFFHVRETYLTSIPELLIHISLTGVLVSFIRLPAESKVCRWLESMGTLIMPYYLLHYVIVMFVVVLIRIFSGDRFIVEPSVYIALSVAVCALSLFLTKKIGVKLMQKLLRK